MEPQRAFSKGIGGPSRLHVFADVVAEARQGEKKMVPDTEAGRRMNEWMQHIDGIRYLDVRDPWLVSP